MNVGAGRLQGDTHGQLHPQPQISLVQLGEELLTEDGEEEQGKGEEAGGAEDGQERPAHAPVNGGGVGPA